MCNVHGFSKGNSKPENLKLVVTHLANLKLSIRLSNVSGEVIQPNKNAKQFSPFCILNFATQGFNYQAEGELSRARKGGKTSMTCTRPTPKFDLNDLKNEEDIRKEIIGYFESTLVDQGKKDWCEGRKLALATLRISKRHDKSPTFSLFYEFLEPTSNVCFLHYYPGRNPFATFDFTDPIPNPVTRALAAANKEYAVSYTRWNFKGEEMEAWTSKELNKGW